MGWGSSQPKMSEMRLSSPSFCTIPLLLLFTPLLSLSLDFFCLLFPSMCSMSVHGRLCLLYCRHCCVYLPHSFRLVTTSFCSSFVVVPRPSPVCPTLLPFTLRTIFFGNCQLVFWVGRVVVLSSMNFCNCFRLHHPLLHWQSLPPRRCLPVPDFFLKLLLQLQLPNTCAKIFQSR